MTNTWSLVRLTAAALALSTACAKSDGDTSKAKAEAEAKAAAAASAALAAPPENSPAATQAEVQRLFTSRCAVCHGTDGKGNGPGAAALTPKPRNYTDTEWQAKVTDDQIKNTILMGGAAVGKSPAMPASPDLQSKPEVLDGLVKVVRAFGK